MKVKHFTQFQEALHKKLCKYRLERRQFARQFRKLEQELGSPLPEPEPELEPFEEIPRTANETAFRRSRLHVQSSKEAAIASATFSERPSMADALCLTRSDDLQGAITRTPSELLRDRRRAKASSARELDASDAFDSREHRPSIAAISSASTNEALLLQQRRASKNISIQSEVFGKLKSALAKWSSNEDAQYLAGIKVYGNEVRKFRQQMHRAHNVPQAIPEDTFCAETALDNQLPSGRQAAAVEAAAGAAGDVTHSPTRAESGASTPEEADLVAYMRDVRQIKTLKFKKMVNTAFTSYSLEDRRPLFTKYAVKRVETHGGRRQQLDLVPLAQTSSAPEATRRREQPFEFAVPSTKRIYKLERLRREARSQYLDTLINASQFNPSV